MQYSGLRTVIGEQSRATRASTSWTTMPKRPSVLAMDGSLALPTVVQHSALPEGSEPPGMGVATARSAKEVKIASLENMFAWECAERQETVARLRNAQPSTPSFIALLFGRFVLPNYAIRCFLLPAKITIIQRQPETSRWGSVTREALRIRASRQSAYSLD